MSEEWLEFKVKPFYVISTDLTVFLFAIWSVMQLTRLVQTGHDINLLTLVSGLFATVASVIATLRYRKHPALTITPTSVSVIASRFPIEEIDYIELDHPKKIVFWIKDGEYEYKKKLNLKLSAKKSTKVFAGHFKK
ncbi:hypothetical protein QA601_00375 [Chitinispirillales bacterium ANBcel5]|uniref:hypothetical protein n=1 Tax=Cellulosispirillum alkaliphilum TaxID=3039283 RepID=UPI002A5521B4|nr:hypothetical protein [Chitinispirillales bacterium ANBcel5]